MFKDFKNKFFKLKNIKIFYKIGGKGKPILLLHGYPQTHFMWSKIADQLAKKFTVIIPDLRGYGQSMSPKGDKNHKTYSKREMAKDMYLLMKSLGHLKFSVAGHDRGGRVAHRLARDYRNNVIKLSVLDICPTLDMYQSTDKEFATVYFHWFFLIQPFDFPERMIKQNPALWMDNCLQKWSKGFDFKKARNEYLKYFKKDENIHASCEDYRAGATIDLVHDRKDKNKKFIVATEPHILHQMKKNEPNKIFLVAPGSDGSCACSNCPYMELNTLEKLRNCLVDLSPKINISNKLILKAKKPLNLMLNLS